MKYNDLLKKEIATLKLSNDMLMSAVKAISDEMKDELKLVDKAVDLLMTEKWQIINYIFRAKCVWSFNFCKYSMFK